jgi:hypothetical protein
MSINTVATSIVTSGNNFASALEDNSGMLGGNICLLAQLAQTG